MKFLLITILVGVLKAASSDLYRHESGIENVAFNCYLNSLFAALYNIPFIQNAVSGVKRPCKTLNLLAGVFSRMNSETRTDPIDPQFCILPIIQSEMKWEFGNCECVMEFWDRFIDSIPDGPFKNEFQIKTVTRYLRKSDGVQVKSVSDTMNYICVPGPPEGQQVSLNSLVNGKFLDEEMDDYIIHPENQSEYPQIFDETTEETADVLKIPVKSVMEIENTPNVLIFGIKRIYMENNKYIFNDDMVAFDDISLNGEAYIPVSYIIFNNEASHYYSVIKDLRSQKFYYYDDEHVGACDISDPENFVDCLKSFTSMAFYIKKSSWDAMQSEEISKINLDRMEPIKEISKINPGRLKPIKKRIKNIFYPWNYSYSYKKAKKLKKLR